jgi:hypothetical protein
VIWTQSSSRLWRMIWRRKWPSWNYEPSLLSRKRLKWTVRGL